VCHDTRPGDAQDLPDLAVWRAIDTFHVRRSCPENLLAGTESLDTQLDQTVECLSLQLRIKEYGVDGSTLSFLVIDSIL